MPRMRDIGETLPTVNPPAEKQTITKADVGTVNAADILPLTQENSAPSAKGIDFAALAKQVQVPGWLTQDQEFVTIDRTPGDWLAFTESSSKHFAKLAQMGCQVGKPFAFIKGEYVKLPDPLQYFLIDSELYRSYMTAKGDFIYVSRDLVTSSRELCEGRPGVDPRHFYNHYVCLLLLILGDRLHPVRAEFRGPKEYAGAMAARGVKAAGTPEWLKSSPAHMITAQMPVPRGRVVCTLTTVSDIGKQSGKELFRAQCSPNPATVEQMMMFMNHLADPDFKTLLDDAKTYFDNRLDFLDTLADKHEKKSTPPTT